MEIYGGGFSESTYDFRLKVKKSMSCNLLLGDCLELMKEIPDGSIDMILADPPFGTTQNHWDELIPFEPLWEQYNRVCKENAAIVLFSQMPFTVDLINSNRKYFRYEIIWNKSHGSGHLNSHRMPLKIHENILLFYRKLPTFNPLKIVSGMAYKARRKVGSENYGNQEKETITVSDGKRYPVDIVNFPECNCSSDKPIHPTQKPVPLLEYLIKTYTNEGETVLDNCAGVMSTAIAAERTGRNCICI